MPSKPIFQQIIHTWMFASPDLAGIIESVKRTGADGLDITINPNMPADRILETDVSGLAKDNGLCIPCCTIGFSDPNLDFSHPDQAVRDGTVNYVNHCLDAVVHMGCDRVQISPTCLHSDHHLCGAACHTSRQDDWKRAVEAMRRSGEYAQQLGVMLLIEPMNHFYVPLVHTIDDGLQMIADVGLSNIHLAPDTFHMNIEEELRVEQALLKAGEHVKCLHVGDNTRRAPGFGTLDWRAIIQALYDIGFTGPISFEPAFPAFELGRNGKDPEYRAFFENELRQGVNYLRAIMDRLQ